MKDNDINFLCVDSSGTTLAVAVMKGDEVLSSFNENTGLTHSCTLMPKIIEMIEKSGLTLSDIDYYVCTNGPGSFTGLRIGGAAMKGLCHAKGKKMVAVSTLESLMYNIKSFDGLVCPIIDARRKEVFAALFKDKKRVLDDCGISLDELFKIIEEKNENVIFVGDGAVNYKDYIKENLKGKCFFANDEDMLQNAVSAGKAALLKIKNGDICDFRDFTLSYLKPSQPERQLNIRV